MTDPAADIRAAERREAQAKEQLSSTLHRLQAKLNPKTLARDVANKAADAGQSAARTGMETAKANPAPVVGAVAVTGLFLARRRIVALFRRKKKLTVPAQARTTPVELGTARPSHYDQGDHT